LLRITVRSWSNRLTTCCFSVVSCGLQGPHHGCWLLPAHYSVEQG
jgi:hypothetical protein